MVSWSLLTVHTTHLIALQLQLMWGLYNGQQRPLTSKKDTKLYIVFFRIIFSVIINNLVRILFSGPGVFLEFLQGAKEHLRAGKVILIFLRWRLITTATVLDHKTGPQILKGSYLPKNYIAICWLQLLCGSATCTPVFALYGWSLLMIYITLNILPSLVNNSYLHDLH